MFTVPPCLPLEVLVPPELDDVVLLFELPHAATTSAASTASTISHIGLRCVSLTAFLLLKGSVVWRKSIRPHRPCGIRADTPNQGATEVATPGGARQMRRRAG